MQEKGILIEDVIKNSIADKNGIKKGDILLQINGYDIQDTLEYRFVNADEHLDIYIRNSNGEIKNFKIKKDYYDDLGIIIEDSEIKNPRRCHNNCVFCFIDQMPKGMRESLYFKDDDSRLSFLYGNFITLTNMSEDDIKRIIKYRISPINVSVHTTNPELRINMLNNKNASNLIPRIKELVEGGIRVNCQIVLCPGINDGVELKRTLDDLFKFFPGVLNVAIVPVGLTRFRDNLKELKPYNKETASIVIDMVESMQSEFENKVGLPFARLADEFYIMADRDLPDIEHYDDFEQLEDGIGMIKYLQNRVDSDLSETNIDGCGKSFGIITGISCRDYIMDICKKISNKINVNISVYSVYNDFFGRTITVSGLLTAKDIINQLKGKINEKTVFIPSNMLKADNDIFLDDISLVELEEKLGLKIVKCKYTGDDLIRNIVEEVIVCQNQ